MGVPKNETKADIKKTEKNRSEEYIWELKFKKANRWDQRCGLWSRHHIATSNFAIFLNFHDFFRKTQKCAKMSQKFCNFFRDPPRGRYEESIAGLRKKIRNKLEFDSPKECPMQI